MSKVQNLFLLALLVLISGCASSGLIETSQRYSETTAGDHFLDKASDCKDRSWLPYRTCGFHFFECPGQNPWTNDSRQVVQAKKNFEYALMANNTYRNDPSVKLFVIPRWEHISRMESDSGLALEVYHRYNVSSKLEEIAIAYEGTDFTSLADWEFNLSLITPDQFKEALAHAEEIRSKYPEIPITATGHSLGGGLALNISMHVEGIKGVAFNSSPRAFFGNQDPNNGNEMVHLYEIGEILGPITRSYLRVRLWNQMLPVRYNFLDFTNFGQWISEHTMYYLARGLMLLAIKGNSEIAAEAFVANIGAEKMNGDKKYCDAIIEKI